jgi:hypothetical protein
MRRLVAFLPLLTLTACPSSGGGENPPVLWLASDGSEIKTRLIDHEPRPF